MDGIKKMEPNWSERELVTLAEAVLPHNAILRGKFSNSITAETKHEIWLEVTNQTIEEVKKKWADMVTLTKKKELERRLSMRETGEGPAPEFFFKEWEKMVLQSLSDVAIEGINCGVDTAAYDDKNGLPPLKDRYKTKNIQKDGHCLGIRMDIVLEFDNISKPAIKLNTETKLL